MAEQKKPTALKRNEFYTFIVANCKGEKPFELVYKKINGELRNAVGKLHDQLIDSSVKGVGFNRDKKMELWKVFQYFDINSKAYRSAKLENIISVKVDNVLYMLED